MDEVYVLTTRGRAYLLLIELQKCNPENALALVEQRLKRYEQEAYSRGYNEGWRACHDSEGNSHSGAGKDRTP